MKFIKGDITTFSPIKNEPCFLLQQTNCTSLRPFGLSATLEEKFPGSCPYSKRKPEKYLKNYSNLATLEDRDKPGTISVVPVGKNLNLVNLFAQYHPGRPSNLHRQGEYSDTEQARQGYFRECLKKFAASLPPSPRIAIPYKIGCGLAKGDWKVYKAILEEFESQLGFELEIYVNESKISEKK